MDEAYHQEVASASARSRSGLDDTDGRIERISMTDPFSPSNDRRAQVRRARDAFPPMGVYAIRNLATGEVRVKSSRNVPGAINRLTFELRQGCHRDRGLQSLWNERGADGVKMDVLELVRERSDPSFDYDAELALLTDLHRQELSGETTP